jgi:hypothetical protein
MAGDGKARHCDAVVEAGSKEIAFERLRTDRSDKHAVEMEAVERKTGKRQMTAVGRIEGPAEKSNFHPALS